MPVQLKIKVTKDVIKKARFCGTPQVNGHPGQTCAIYYSINDVLPGVFVGKRAIFINGDYWDYASYNTIPLPKEARLSIHNFDELDPVTRLLMSEIEFEITVPDSVIETINIEEVTKLLINHPTLSLCQ